MQRFLAASLFLLFSVTASGQQQPAPRPPPPSTLRAPTRADILRGEYGRYRANNDLLYYDLDIRVNPEKKCDLRQEHHPLQDAQGRHAHPVGAVLELHHREDRDGLADAEVRARSQHRLRRFSRRRSAAAAPTRSSFTTPASRAKRAGLAPWPSGPIRPASTGSIPRTKVKVRRPGGPARINGATSPKAPTSASPFRTA